ncbi:g12859 [Coccomyxa viridis]|uniref:G12859 protein n=1 Tax=Coccomyxa viridis TaxID=1274662 RepID=A0ABP1GBE0_9CHLO
MDLQTIMTLTLSLHRKLLRNLLCWPPILAGKDVQAVAQPGSGKTFGYLLPALPKLISAKKSSQARTVLILVPTRELAQQVADSCSSLRKLYKLRVACIVGGSDRAAQAQSLAGKPDIIVATPGRLIDLADSADSALSSVGYLVLDEADKMLSLGFKTQLDQIWTSIVLLFTATMPAEVATAAAQWQRDPVCINMHQAEAPPASNVTQVVQVCAEHKKPRKLQKHLEQVKAKSEQGRSKPRILVFCNKVKTVRFVHTLCVEAGVKAAMLHGERSQPEREAALQAFKNGTAQILVATDVAGRGLHIKNLPYIVNYDFPSRMEAYIHRVGRTGRLASSGHAFSFFTRNLAPLARPLLNHLLDHDQSVDPNLVKLADAFDIANAKLKEASEGAAGASSPAEPAADPGSKGEKGKVKGRKKKTQSSDGSSAQKAFGEQTVVKQKQKPLRQEPSGLKVMREPPEADNKGPSMKRVTRKALPGRLRKKLAKEATISSSFTLWLLSELPALAEKKDFSQGGGFAKESYYVTLGLFLLSLPGLWSQIKRAPKAKKVRKTFEVAGPARSDALPLDERARQLFAYFKHYNYEVMETGETIRFAGTYKASRGQAAALIFYVFCGLASTALVLSIAAPFGGQNWYWLTLLSPLSGFYYWQRGTRQEEVQVKMVTADDDSVTDILVEGPEEEVMRLRKEFNLMEKGKELVKGLLEQ